MRRRGDGHEQATPFVEAAQYVREGILLRVPPQAVPTLLVLLAHTNSKGEAWPSAKEISRLTGRKPENIYKDFREIERLHIFERIGNVRSPSYNVPGAIVFRLIPFDEERVRRVLLAIPITGRAKRGDASRFRRAGTAKTRRKEPSSPYKEAPAIPENASSSPYNDRLALPMIGGLANPDSGTQKGYLKGEEKRDLERVFGKGVVGRNPFTSSPGGNAFPPDPLSDSLSSQDKDKGTAREKNQDVGRLASYFVKVEPGEWERHARLLERQGYRLGEIEKAKNIAAGIAPHVPPLNEQGKEDRRLCHGITRTRTECVLSPLPGRLYCRRHQRE